MPSNFLQMIQTVCDELGLNRPSTAINSTDLQVRQLCALMKRELREIQQNYDFTRLQVEYDLRVNQPIQMTGSVEEGGYVISGLTFPSNSDFSPDFNTDFGPLTGGFINPALWVVNGQNLPVDTRVVGNVSSSSVRIDQPATGTATNAPFVFAQDTYPVPADFDRYINQTWWDRTNHWALLGPDSPQVDEWHRSGIVTIGPRRHFRQIGYNGLTNTPGPVNCYRIWPPPGATDTPLDLVFEYISNYTVLSANGTPQATFLADSDIPILDENIFILGTKWRFFQIKGFDYAPLQTEYQDYVDRKYGHDGGAKTLSLSGLRANFLLSSGNIADGNWPGPMGGGSY